MTIRFVSANVTTAPSYARATVTAPNANTGFTIAHWVRRPASVGIGASLLFTGGKECQFVLGGTFRWTIIGSLFGATTTVLSAAPTSVWRHEAIVWNGTQLVSYSNGVAVTTVTPAAGAGSINWAFVSLSSPASGAVTGDVYIQDAQFYARALTQAEIILVSDTRRALQGVVGWYPTASTPSLFTDWSPNSNTLAPVVGAGGSVGSFDSHAPVSWGGQGTQQLVHRYTEITPAPPGGSGGGFGSRRRFISAGRRPVRA